jgi:DNA repair exonuclease SbcCD nuclease subunit
MKIICVTDTHLGVKQDSPLYHDVTNRLFANIYDYAEHHKIKELIHLGDFWNNRRSVSIKTILQGLYIAENLNKVFDHISLITGNHDTIYKDSNDESLLRMFNKFENISIIQRPTTRGNVIMVPWLFDPEVLLNRENKMVLLGHFDIAGAVMNESGSVSLHGQKQSDFNNFKMVLSGHYHTPGTYGNIRYLGSPFHTSFNDVAGVRGFYVLDDETCELEFIEFDDYPKFVRIHPDSFYSRADLEGNIVELIFTKDLGINGNIAAIQMAKDCDPLTLTPKYVNINTSMSKEDIVADELEVKDHLGILNEYLDGAKLPDNINTSVLKKVAESIYKETINDKQNS